MIGGTLALDLSTRTGWAYARPGSSPAPSSLEIASGLKADQHLSGSILLGDGAKDWVRKLIALEEFLDDFFAIHKPARVTYEAPYAGGSKLNQDTVQMLFGLSAVTAMKCYKLGLGHNHTFKSNITEARKHFAGKSPRGRKEAKLAVKHRCMELNWPYFDEDECDALCVLDHGLYCMTIDNDLPPIIEQPIDF